MSRRNKSRRSKSAFDNNKRPSPNQGDSTGFASPYNNAAKPKPPKPKKKPKPKPGSPDRPGGNLAPGNPLNGLNGNGGGYASPESPRDLNAILAYGTSYEPWVSAWTESRVAQVQAFRRWVYIAIDSIATKIAGHQPNLSYLRVNGKASRRDDVTADDDTEVRAAETRCKLWQAHGYRKALVPLLSHQWLDPVEHNHPLVRLLSDPNDRDNAYDLWYETIMFLLLTGSSYWWMPRNPKTGLPVAIWVLPAHWVWPVVGREHLIEGWELRPVEGNYLRQVLPAEEVVHFLLKNPVSKIDGFSPLTAIAQWVDVDASVAQAKLHTYKNGTFPTVAIQFDGQLNDPTDDFLRRVEAKFMTRYVGEQRSNKPLFLPPGVKVIPLTIKPNEMVFGESATETRNNILAGYKVPPIIAGLLDGVSGDAIEAAQVGFCELAINPRLNYLGQTISEKVCPMFPPSSKGRIRCWWESHTRNDPRHQEEMLKTDMLMGAISTDELRILRGREPWGEEWSRRPLVPVNMAPLTLPGGGVHQNPNSTPPSSTPAQPELAPENPPNRDTKGVTEFTRLSYALEEFNKNCYNQQQAHAVTPVQVVEPAQDVIERDEDGLIKRVIRLSAKPVGMTPPHDVIERDEEGMIIRVVHYPATPGVPVEPTLLRLEESVGGQS